jgi:hypothetical protein
MKRSTVVGAGNKGVVDDIRTSAGTFLMWVPCVGCRNMPRGEGRVA